LTTFIPKISGSVKCSGIDSSIHNFITKLKQPVLLYWIVKFTATGEVYRTCQWLYQCWL